MLENELIDRIDDPAHLEHIAQRAQSKLTQRLLTDAIKASGGGGIVYAQVNDANNIAITGQNAKQIVASRAAAAAAAGTRKRPPTRDLFQTEELQFLELQEQRALMRHNAGPGSNAAILAVQQAVVAKYNTFKQ